jgi:hypothetical protein
MGITDYLNAKKQAQDLEASLVNVDFLGAMSKAYESIAVPDANGYGMLDMKKLENPVFRKKFEDAAMGFLTEKARKYVGVPTTVVHDVFQENRLLRGHIGFTRTGFHALMGNLKSEASYENISKALRRNIGDVLDEIRATPITKLNSGLDTGHVIDYTGAAGKIDPMKLALEDESELAGILDAYEQFGVVPPKLYENKPYKI